MIKAIIFDMDGVVSDTQKLHSKVESEILSRFDINLTPDEITQRYSGVKTKEFVSQLLAEKGIETDIMQLMVEKWQKMEELAEQTVDPIDGIFEMLDQCKNLGLKMAIGTASNINYATKVLNSLNILNKFDFIVTGDMVKAGKPEPDIFLLAANKIKMLPTDCVVIEDGLNGMIAANRAGMKCIALVKNIDFNKYPTKNQVLSLHDIDQSYLISL
ncbi:MAG: HAD family phosphatase [Candidatus Paceibacterota bacterium]